MYINYTGTKRCITRLMLLYLVSQAVQGGCVVGDGSGKWITFNIASYSGFSPVPILYITQWNSPTSEFGAVFTGAPLPCAPENLFLSIYDDGTNLNFQISLDGGQNWDTVYTQLRSSFLTAGPSQFGFGMAPSVSSHIQRANFLHWAVQ